MKVFECRRIGNKFRIKFAWFKITFHLFPQKNHYISLGTNCFNRFALTKFYLKAERKKGELSCPFDLCTTPPETIVKLLQNNFSDFFDDIVKQDASQWAKFINTKYSMYFPHDENLTLEQFKERYKKRIENFYQISKEKSMKKYVYSCDMSVFDVEGLNKLYKLISELRKDKPFEFHVLIFTCEDIPKININKLNKNIFYKEIDLTGNCRDNTIWSFDWLSEKINESVLNNL